MFKKPPVSVLISSPVSREQRGSVPEREEQAIRTCVAASFGRVSVAFLFAALRVSDNQKNKSLARCSVICASPPLNFGATFTRAVFLRELILMHR